MSVSILSDDSILEFFNIDRSKLSCKQKHIIVEILSETAKTIITLIKEDNTLSLKSILETSLSISNEESEKTLDKLKLFVSLILLKFY